jgi:hypothetical protein
MVALSIMPLARGEHVDVEAIGDEGEISDLARAIDYGAKYQRVAISPESELELSNIVNVEPVTFLSDGRWSLQLRAGRADVLSRRPKLSTK